MLTTTKVQILTGKCVCRSMGVVLYVLLTGQQPFIGKSIDDTRDLMKTGDYAPPKTKDASPMAADLLQKLLEKDPKKVYIYMYIYICM